MLLVDFPAEENSYLSSHIDILCACYEKLVGCALVRQCPKDMSRAEYLFEAPFVLLSHDNSKDPVFTYVNKQGLKLFELNWREFIGMPSRLSAEPLNREERAQLLKQVNEKGYIEHYSGTRISASGSRFIIKRATVWNLHDAAIDYSGQATKFNS